LFAGPSHKSQPNQSTDQIRDQNTARVRRPQRLVGLKHDARGNDLTRSMHHYYYLLFSLHGATLTARRDYKQQLFIFLLKKHGSKHYFRLKLRMDACMALLFSSSSFDVGR
jgi:hypothetical protein